MSDTYDDLFKKYKVITEGIEEPDPWGDGPTLIDESLTLYYQKFMMMTNGKPEEFRAYVNRLDRNLERTRKLFKELEKAAATWAPKDKEEK
jgi:hypothetical protein